MQGAARAELGALVESLLCLGLASPGAVAEHPGEAAELEKQSFLPPFSSYCSFALGQHALDTEKWPLLPGRCVSRLVLGDYRR